MAQGLIPGVSSIAVPNYTRVPFEDFLGTTRLDWSQSPRLQWFLRGGMESYLINNNLGQQATPPSTGATHACQLLQRSSEPSVCLHPYLAGSFTFTASTLYNTQTRNSDYGFALAFPSSATSSTISGCETFGDQQF